MQEQASLNDLEAELQGLEADLVREIANGRRATLASTGVALAVVSIVLGFAWTGYSRLRDAWTAEKFTVGMQQELEELNPTATEELNRLGQALLPVYAAETRRQFDTLAPEIAHRVGEQFELLASDLHHDIHTRLVDLDDDLQKRTERIIADSYPGLATDAQKARVAATFEDITQDAVLASIGDFEDRFSKDVVKVQDCLARFNAAESTEPTVELQKRFISLWLRMLDAEIQKL
ncbi:MAG TPA: hypothetical protein VF384_00375 [Planctomycetota bacterium]